MLGSLCALPRNAPDVPGLTVHINFIRVMINALDGGQLVPPKGGDVAKESTSMCKIITKIGDGS